MRLRSILPFLVAALIILGTIPIRFASIRADLWISFPVHFGVFLLLLSRLQSKPSRILLSYLAAPLIMCAIDFVSWHDAIQEKFINTLWPNVLPGFVAPIFAYWFYVSKAQMRIPVTGLALLLYFANIFWLPEKWNNFRNWGTFSNDVSEKVPRDWLASSVHGNRLTVDSLNGKITLLDFWNSGCVSCIRSFPVLNSFYQLTKSDSRVRIQSIFIPFGERDTPGHAEMMVARKHASFPVVSSRGLDSVFGIRAYPTVLLVYNDHIIHRGSLETAMAKMNDILRGLDNTQSLQ